MNDRDEWPEPAAVAVMRRRAEKAEAEVERLRAGIVLAMGYLNTSHPAEALRTLADL